ncbi:hypothetical protein [Phaeovulum vinaykumarii]|uniref:Uncharacterized protein n=1 Tax=Phaeovulum vinaykumarii TaxID=407234 RepID=A0A1N7M4I7_9RHOB|nr:hypothetical protein [Phaeovulum vinaykumarii]SIS80889.1 hypothetical protein SAMN05421795_105170 [Phaeovulum vinaykumarii]SOC08861.1 hypothetical protein SAMN05878426_10532 [Phaeovulum vinaykumarii]
MLGVIVWSNRERQAAAIWCEDLAQLAHLNGAASLHPGQRPHWPQTGDLAEFDIAETDGLRRAARLRVLPQEADDAGQDRQSGFGGGFRRGGRCGG